MINIKKKRNLLGLIAIIIIYITPVYAQQYPKVPADMPLYQNEMNLISEACISLKTEWGYSISGGKVSAFKYKSRVINYDKLGRIKEIMNINPMGESLSVIVFKYDNRNLPLQETEFLPTGELIGKTKYTYNQKGRLTDITWLNEFEFIIDRKVFDYNDSKNLITEWQYYSPDSVANKTEYFYSNLENGILLKQNNFIGENKIDRSITYIRDSLQTLQKEEIRDARKKLICYYEYKYNRDQRLYQIVANYINDKKIPIYVYDYSPEGLITGEIEYNHRGDLIDYKMFTYE